MSGLPVLTSPLLEVAGVRHAFFTRQGGVSTGLYASLNVGLGSNDDPDAVQENRRRCAAHFGAEAIVTAYQVHSATALVADGPWPAGPPQADAIASATPGVVCGALAADCAPVLIVDPQSRVVAAAHAGWKGALTGVVEATVARMVSLGADRNRLRAAIGPCIGPKSYEVGLEFLERFVHFDPSLCAVLRHRRQRPTSACSTCRPSSSPAWTPQASAPANGWATTPAPSPTGSSPTAAPSSWARADYGRLLSAIMLER